MSGDYIPLNPPNRSSYSFQLYSPTPPPNNPPGLGGNAPFRAASPSEGQVVSVPDTYMDPDALLSPPSRPRTGSKPRGPKPPSSQSSRRSSLLSTSIPEGSALSFSAAQKSINFDTSARSGPSGSKAGNGGGLLPAGAGKPEPQIATSIYSIDKSSHYDTFSPPYSDPFNTSPASKPSKVVFSTPSSPRSTTYGDYNQPQSSIASSDPLLQKPTSSPSSAPGAFDKDFSYPFTNSPAKANFSSSNVNEYGFRALDYQEDEDPYKPRYRMSTYSTNTVRNHPFGKWFRAFERPQWKEFGVHVALCIVAYPVLLIFVIAARGKSLFWSRVLVGMGCGLVGITLGFSLLRLARPIIEAATWATLIHQSRVQDRAGIRLKDFAAHTDDPSSALGALRLIWDRRKYPGADRRQRRYYDTRPWTVWILIFLVNVGLAGALTFVFGRLVDIEIHIIHQEKNYWEYPVKNDLTPADSERAVELNKAFENYALTWTLAPFSTHGGLPSVVGFPWQSESSTSSEVDSRKRRFQPRGNPYLSAIGDAADGYDMVYFSEVVTNQLVPNGSGFGTFEALNTPANLTSTTGGLSGWASDDLTDGQVTELEPGALLRLPRWGIRIKCEKAPDIIPRSESNKTYVLLKRDALRGLFDHFGYPFPAQLEQPLDTTKVRGPDGVNDTLPSDADLASIALGGLFYDNGVAHSMKSDPISMGEDDSGGIITIETLLVRLNTTYAQNGKFTMLSQDSVPDKDGVPTFIGYDATVCLQLYEPWIVQVYNGSMGNPNSVKLCDKGVSVHDMSWSTAKEVMKGKSLKDGPELWREVNSSRLRDAYIAGHQNSVNQMLKDNGRDSFYVPSPTLISYTDGEGAYGYTELSTAYYAKSRAIADASNVLPYFAGSGSTVARLYPDKTVSVVAINNGFYALAIAIVFIMGVISTFFVPRLPLGSPRRGFDIFSWMTAFAAREIVPDRAGGLDKQMELKDIVQHAGEMRYRYVG